jgi:hypothetical protein
MIEDTTKQDADAGPVQLEVRPVAWKVRHGTRTYYVSDDEFVRSSYDYGEFVPLYGPEAVAAERERCANVCDDLAAEADGQGGHARASFYRTAADRIRTA